MTKLRVDMRELTLGELADVGELLHERWKVTLADAMQGPLQARAMAALAWIVRRRDDAGYTYEQAETLRMGDLEMVNPEDDAPGEPSAGDSGAALPPSPAFGV